MRRASATQRQSEVPQKGGARDFCRGRSSVWLEHSTVTREVAGSNPVAPVVGGSLLDRCWIAVGVREGEHVGIALVVKLVDTPS